MCGAIIFGALIPFLGPVVMVAMLWEFVDRGGDGGFVKSGRELSGVVMKHVSMTCVKKNAIVGELSCPSLSLVIFSYSQSLRS